MIATRVVFDCVTFLQALANPNGPAAACWNLARTKQTELHVSQPILDEVADVITRPKIAAKFRFTNAIAQAFLQELGAVAHFVSNVPPLFSLPRDPKDEPYVNLALAVQATHLITWDKDLLDLMSVNNVESQAIRQLHAGLRVVTPRMFLQEVSSSPS